LRPGATNDYFLCATFSRPADKRSAPNCHSWQGAIQLPQQKMPIDKIKDILGMKQ
jgi:hypothetical protein